MTANNLTFGFNLDNKINNNKKESKKENLHFFLLDDLRKKLSGRLIELNHAGINFSTKYINQTSYNEFKSEVASRSNLYHYPTGEEWPFIIPATQKEFLSDIKDTSLNRNPKFEIVYATYNNNPVIQLDFKTNFTKNEIFELFPDPYGVSFDGLEDIFRTIFIKIDWENILLRFDLRFNKNGKDFGYWMIEEGGRIK